MAEKNAMMVIWCLVVLLFSGSPYQTIFNINILIFVFGAIALVLSLPSLIRARIREPQWALIFLALMTFVTMTVHFEFGSQFYWRFLCIVIIAYYLSQAFTFKQITKTFTKIMLFVTLVSLVGYALANSTNILNILPRFKNINGVEYAIGIVFNFITMIPERNCGIFWEPGIFATYLILAIVFEILAMRHNSESKKKNIIHIVIFAIGLLTANSTAGFLLGVICVLFFFVSHNAMNKKTQMLLNLFSIGLLVLSLIALANLDSIIMNTALINNKYIAKLLSSNLEESARVTVVWHNLEVFFNNFLCGAGIYEVSLLDVQFADISTVTYILSVFGVLGLTYIGCIIKGVFQQKNINAYSKLIVFVVLIAVTSKEPHLEMLFTWILIFALLKDKHAL